MNGLEQWATTFLLGLLCGAMLGGAGAAVFVATLYLLPDRIRDRMTRRRSEVVPS